MGKAYQKSLDAKQGMLPKQYRNLIANEQWHSWSIRRKDLAKMEDDAKMDSIIQQHRKNVEIVIQLAGLVLGEQEMSLDDQHPYPLLTKIVTELAEMILADGRKSLSRKRSPFSVNQETIDKTKALGSRLNELGGVDLMRSIATDYVPRCDQKELELIWHGIGDWRA